MSQFFGCIALNAQINISDVAAQMTNSMSFFQGDAIGIYQTNEVFICNKFLFNTPESVNTTNICQNERYILAASCRIDNREEIAKKVNISNPLEVSDHEYILAACTFYEQECVKHLIGDFSFVVWDKQKQTLFMAKDHLGIKPLFYTLQNENLFFSTDLNAFLKITNLNIKYSKSYLASLLFGSYLQTSVELQHTCYENIYRLKPAYFGIFYTNSLILNQYWKLQPQKQLKLGKDSDYYAQFFDLFKEAVSCRMRTNDAIGLELSGGLDSSCIACMAHEITGNNINNLHSYSLVQSVEGARVLVNFYDEEPFQEIVLKQIKLNRNNVFKNSTHPFSHFLDEYEYGYKVHGGISKVNFTWQMPIYKLMQENKCSVKLSGFAGDELVTNIGNNWYFEAFYQFDIKLISCLLISFKWESYKKILSYVYQRLFGIRHDNESKNKEKDSNFLDKKCEYLLHKKVHFFDIKSFQHYLISHICRPYTTLRFETENLHAMRFGTECRYPMSDIRLLEYVLSTPSNLHNPEKINRPFIREALKTILPKAIYNRADKASAVVPYFKYKNDGYKQQILSILSNKNLQLPFPVDKVRFEKYVKNISGLHRDTDIASLMQILFLAEKLDSSSV